MGSRGTPQRDGLAEQIRRPSHDSLGNRRGNLIAHNRHVNFYRTTSGRYFKGVVARVHYRIRRHPTNLSTGESKRKRHRLNSIPTPCLGPALGFYNAALSIVDCEGYSIHTQNLPEATIAAVVTRPVLAAALPTLRDPWQT